MCTPIPVEQFKGFRVAPDDEVTIHSKFRVLMADCRLGELTAAKCRTVLPNESGCYLSLMRIGDTRYKIYLGQTDSIRRRITDYCNNFQIHSPNDFKLRFFEESMRQFFPEAALDLYFAPTRRLSAAFALALSGNTAQASR